MNIMNASAAGIEIAAYADICIERAESFLAKYGGRYATADWTTLISDRDLDGVLIQTGERMHPEIVIAAAKAGKNIFVEKPIARNVEDAIAAEHAVLEAGVCCSVGFAFRMAPAVERAARMLPNPWITVAQCSDAISEQAPHILDLILHVLHKARLVAVYAVGGRAYDLDPHLPVDSFVATMSFDDGSQASYVQHGKAYNALMGKFSCQMFGRDRCVYLANRFKECHLSTSLESPDFSTVFQGPDYWSSEPWAAFKDVRGPNGYTGHFRVWEDLADAICNDRPAEISISQARYVLQVEHAIFESIATGQTVDTSGYGRDACEDPAERMRVEPRNEISFA